MSNTQADSQIHCSDKNFAKKQRSQSKNGPERETRRGITSADPVADAGQPLGVGGGLGVDEEARLLAAVAEGAEGVVAVAAATALPVAFLPLPHRRPLLRRRQLRARARRRRRRRKRWGRLGLRKPCS
ncbi:hypothetical protein GW17_00005876 [Ensete ventricosum]|nr:hypothetical protein GW17_00005876 [Ensete ventricosum]